jgi:hypothetical protein
MTGMRACTARAYPSAAVRKRTAIPPRRNCGDGVWWARIGKPVDHQDGSRDWILGNYLRIPDELIVKGDDGLPVRNPEGAAVLCHSIVWMNGNEIDPVNTTLFCFVPGPQS